MRCECPICGRRWSMTGFVRQESWSPETENSRMVHVFRLCDRHEPFCGFRIITEKTGFFPQICQNSRRNLWGTRKRSRFRTERHRFSIMWLVKRKIDGCCLQTKKTIGNQMNLLMLTKVWKTSDMRLMLNNQMECGILRNIWNSTGMKHGSLLVLIGTNVMVKLGTNENVYAEVHVKNESVSAQIEMGSGNLVWTWHIFETDRCPNIARFRRTARCFYPWYREGMPGVSKRGLPENAEICRGWSGQSSK